MGDTSVHLNKLSVDFLYEAFTYEETCEGHVFLIAGRQETLEKLLEFARAMVPKQPRNPVIWGAPLVADGRIPPGSVILGVTSSLQFPSACKYEAAILHGLSKEHQKPVPGEPHEGTVWGRLLNLS